MRVLLTGANGFIGAHLTGRLLASGHDVVAAVRRPAAFQRRYPQVEAIFCDLERDVTPDVWIARLVGIDAVVNCAGILQAARGQSIDAIHHRGPAALFDACLRAGVKRVVQVSAISADPEVGTDYALSKHQADLHLQGLSLDWVILRPSLVYASGSYGGTSLLRGLAALPWIVPLVGDGEQRFQPIHVDDLAATVLASLERQDFVHSILDPVGPGTLTLKEILRELRGWMGVPAALWLRVPLPIVRLACRLGDLAGAGPLRTTSLRQIEYGNVGDPTSFAAKVGFTPLSFAAALALRPSEEQDRWHARLYFVRPFLTVVLAVLWLASGLIGLATPTATVAATLDGLGISAGWARFLGTGTSMLDLGIGVALLRGSGRRVLGPLQLVTVFGYSLALSVASPGLWLDPFGPLLKNLPILGAILAWAAMEEGR